MAQPAQSTAQRDMAPISPGCRSSLAARADSSSPLPNPAVDDSGWEPDGVALQVRFCEGGGPRGLPLLSNFCTICGTTILTEFDVDPGHVSIKACSLDDASWLKPDRHLFASRTQPCLKLN